VTLRQAVLKNLLWRGRENSQYIYIASHITCLKWTHFDYTPPWVCNFLRQLSSVCSSGVQTTHRTSDDAKGAQRRKATMNRRRLNTGNVLLNFYFVIQYVLFIFILVYVWFHSTSLRPLPLIVFESLKQHDETVHSCLRLCASFRVLNFPMPIWTKYILSTKQHCVHPSTDTDRQWRSKDSIQSVYW
jgi:hypothetical protein